MNDDTIRALQVPLNPAFVSVLQAGPAAGSAYLDIATVLYEATEIFGAGGWGFVLDGRPFVLTQGGYPDKPGKDDVWAAVGHVTIAGGEAHGDMGTCIQSGPGARAAEMGAKGAVSDCIKRCMSHIADRLGLVLRDKEATAHDGAEIGRRWREYMQETGGEVPTRELPSATEAPAPTPFAVPYGWAEDYKAKLSDARKLAAGIDGKVIRHIVGVDENCALEDMLAGIDAWLAKGGTIDALMSRAVDLVNGRQPVGGRR